MPATNYANSAANTPSQEPECTTSQIKQEQVSRGCDCLCLNHVQSHEQQPSQNCHDQGASGSKAEPTKGFTLKAAKKEIRRLKKRMKRMEKEHKNALKESQAQVERLRNCIKGMQESNDLRQAGDLEQARIQAHGQTHGQTLRPIFKHRVSDSPDADQQGSGSSKIPTPLRAELALSKLEDALDESQAQVKGMQEHDDLQEAHAQAPRSTSTHRVSAPPNAGQLEITGPVSPEFLRQLNAVQFLFSRSNNEAVRAWGNYTSEFIKSANNRNRRA